MIKKILKLLRNPTTEYKKIRPFIRTKIKARRHVSAVRKYQKDLNRLIAAHRSGETIKLHFGCGPRVLKGWMNIDLHYEAPDNYIQHYGDKYYPTSLQGTKDDFFAIDILKTGLPLPGNSVDAIFHEDFIEHIDQKEQFLFLAETLRVLKPGSVHRVNTPDLIASMQKHSDFSKGSSGVYVGEWDGNGHKSLYTSSHLKEIALEIGYSDVVFNGRNKSISKYIPAEYRPGIDRAEDGNVFADLIK